MAEDDGNSYLVGGIVALALAPLLLLVYYLDTLKDGVPFAPSGGQLGLWIGTAALGVYLVVAAAPWATRASAPFLWLRKLAVLPFLALLSGFMFVVRMIPYQVRLDEAAQRVYFAGSTDPFYHYRAMIGIVRNFPAVPRWDPWTHYPVGTATGQFATLFDWLPAAWIVLTKGRDASEYDIQVALSVYTAIIGAVIVIPFFFLAKRLLGTIPAVVASVALAFMPGGFLAWGLATAGDHHGAEALGSVVTMLGAVYAADRAHALRGRIHKGATFRELLPVIGVGLVGALALTFNMYMWPPALLFGAIVTAWLTVCILLENAKDGGDARGLAVGGAITLGVAGLLMIPVMDSTFLGEFNTYGILHVLACLFAAAWLLGVHWASTFEARHGWSPWIVPGIVAGAALVVFIGVRVFLKDAAAGIAWGLSWITGIGTPRTTATIGEAQKTAFFCTESARAAGENCLNDDFGILPAVTFFILIAVIVWAIVKRRRADILIAGWAFVIFRAVDTQARFGYYLAVVMALLLGWLAARLGDVGTIFDAPAPKVVKKTKGVKRDVRAARERTGASLAVRAFAAGAVALLILPGNVFASDRSFPSWEIAGAYASRSGDLVVWLDGLEWMRANTPEAGVDLAKIYDRPPVGQLHDYPPETYGVLSWWDYGHWIETSARRPPVANPFQQAAPFASTWFTERVPERAEEQLTAWERGANPVRYVWIDDEMDTSKYGAITVWANSQNASRPIWPTQDYVAERKVMLAGREVTAFQPSTVFRETMMARLYEDDGDLLGNYRLVYEHGALSVSGSVLTDDGRVRCFHDIIPSQSCGVSISNAAIEQWRSDPRTAVRLGQDANAYDLEVRSRLKLFERVEGARLTGTAPPGSEVTALLPLKVTYNEQNWRTWQHRVTTTAGPDGAYELRWPYPTAEFLTPAEGGTNSMVAPQGKVTVQTAVGLTDVDVGERAVLDGLVVSVA